MRRVQWTILPVALIVSLMLPCFTETLLSIINPRGRGTIAYELVKGVGWRDGIAALCFENLPTTEGQIIINVTRAFRCSLFRRGETPIVWLGPYKLKGVRIYDGRRDNVILELEKGGQGEAYMLRGLSSRSEAYALLKEGDTVTLVFLFRVVEDYELIEIRGSARGASKVEAFAYTAKEDFDASQPPLRSLFVTGSEVVDGKFLLRMERDGAPFTRHGQPLLEVNSTLVLYTECSYAVIDLKEYMKTSGTITLTVNIDCEEPREQQVP